MSEDRLDKLFERLESKIDKASERGLDHTRRIEKKLDDHMIEERDMMFSVVQKLERLQTQQIAHEKSNEHEFALMAEEIRDAKKDQKGLWKLFAAGGGGGALAAFMEWFSRDPIK